MRKKSHISLAQYLIKNMDVKDLSDHKKAFYIGSILPDIKLSFITKRHTIEETFQDLLKEIKKITVDYDAYQGINGYYARHLGIITHYLADYCTYPHNTVFHGSMKEHIYYEKDLKFFIRKYLKSEAAGRNREQLHMVIQLDDIVFYIEKMHSEYLKAVKEVKEDVLYIVELCYTVVDAILYLFECAINNMTSGHNGRKDNMQCSNI